jgi:hypothetical protein
VLVTTDSSKIDSAKIDSASLAQPITAPITPAITGLLDVLAESAVHMATVASPVTAERPARRRRGLPGQRARRLAEHRARHEVVEARARLSTCGLSLSAFSAALGRSDRTLRQWAARHADPFDALSPVALGRPPKRGTAADRNLVLAALSELGPFTPIASLRQLAPTLARREVDELRWRYRVNVRARGRATAQVLTWHRPGAVWAMDYTEVPWRIDGAEKYVLSVRDLASGYQLLALVAERADALTTRRALEVLFAEHGPPLVLKSDNGSHFAQGGVRALLDERRVLHLRCPRRLARLQWRL